MKDTILTVEDDRDILEVVTIMLGREGFKVLKATNGKEAIEGVSKKPDLIILDVMLPDMDGFTVCRRIREESLAPVLFLTAKAGVQDKTEGLEAGGDDYLVKPFDFEELLARIRVMTRKRTGNRSNVFQYLDLSVDIQKRIVTRGGKDISLIPKESLYRHLKY